MSRHKDSKNKPKPVWLEAVGYDPEFGMSVFAIYDEDGKEIYEGFLSDCYLRIGKMKSWELRED